MEVNSYSASLTRRKSNCSTTAPDIRVYIVSTKNVTLDRREYTGIQTRHAMIHLICPKLLLINTLSNYSTVKEYLPLL